MKRIAALVVAAALPLGAAARPKKPAPAPPPKLTAPEATAKEESDGTRYDLAGDGPLLGWAAPKDASGHRTLYVLLGPPPPAAPDTTCRVEEASARDGAADARLFRFEIANPPRLIPIRAGLPHGALEAADVDADGVDELLLLRAGAIDRIDPRDGGPHTALRDDALPFAADDPRAARSAADAADLPLRLTVAAEFRSYRGAPGGALAETSDVDLPVHVNAGGARIEIATPEVVAIGQDRAGRRLFATAPEAVGNLRLRTWLLAPDAAPAERAVECWAQLPEPERVLDSAFALLNGAPVLVVLTMSAEKLAVFSEKRLRIFGLGGDRTRSGDGPRFSAVTGLNLWQIAYPVVRDLDGDGREDLILPYWKGINRTIAAIEVYPGAADGSFGKPRTTEFSVNEGDDGFLSFGPDVDGDGRPDLVLIAGGRVVVYPGSPAPKALARPVDASSPRSVALVAGSPGARALDVSFDPGGGVTISRRAPGLGTPRALDLDGDGRDELVFAGDLAGAGRLSVVSFRSRGAASPR